MGIVCGGGFVGGGDGGVFLFFFFFFFLSALVGGGEWMWWLWVDVEVSFCCDFFFSFFVNGGCGMGGGFLVGGWEVGFVVTIGSVAPAVL